MVIANDETAAVIKPGVTRIVVREVCIVLSSVDLIVGDFEVGSFTFQVAVELLSRDDDNGRINCAE